MKVFIYDIETMQEMFLIHVYDPQEDWGAMTVLTGETDSLALPDEIKQARHRANSLRCRHRVWAVVTHFRCPSNKPRHPRQGLANLGNARHNLPLQLVFLRSCDIAHTPCAWSCQDQILSHYPPPRDVAKPALSRSPKGCSRTRISRRGLSVSEPHARRCLTCSSATLQRAHDRGHAPLPRDQQSPPESLYHLRRRMCSHSYLLQTQGS